MCVCVCGGEGGGGEEVRWGVEWQGEGIETDILNGNRFIFN